MNYVVLISDIDPDGARYVESLIYSAGSYFIIRYPSLFHLTLNHLLSNRYYIYEVQTRNNFALSPNTSDRDVPKLQHVVWAPKNAPSANLDDTQQAIAFVYKNDVYYKPRVQNDLVHRITVTGAPSLVYNGIPDWFYTNVPELRGETITFSEDGSFMSYMTFNDTGVHEYK